LTSVPTLKFLDIAIHFLVCTNACNKGIRRVLTQKYHMVCYESQKLKEHERNYDSHDLELVVINHALKMWRQYLMGSKFELRTDHCGMKHLFGHPTLNARQTRWLESLSEDGWNFLVNVNLKLSISKARKIRWLMHSAEELMKCILHYLEIK